MTEQAHPPIRISFHSNWAGILASLFIAFCTCTWSCGNLHVGGHELGCGEPKGQNCGDTPEKLEPEAP